MNAITAKTAVSSIVLALAALATFGSASSFAAASDVKNSAGEPLFPAFTSVLTRAQVQADYGYWGILKIKLEMVLINHGRGECVRANIVLIQKGNCNASRHPHHG